MLIKIRTWIRRLVTSAMGIWILQSGCIRDVQRELEVLFATEANLDFIQDSFIVNLLGPQILKLYYN